MHPVSLKCRVSRVSATTTAANQSSYRNLSGSSPLADIYISVNPVNGAQIISMGYYANQEAGFHSPVNCAELLRRTLKQACFKVSSIDGHRHPDTLIIEFNLVIPNNRVYDIGHLALTVHSDLEQKFLNAFLLNKNQRVMLNHILDNMQICFRGDTSFDSLVL